MNTETAKASSEESKKYASNQEYRTTIFEMNVQDDKSVQAMVDFVVKEYGRLDYAVNAAGVSHIHSPSEPWWRLIACVGRQWGACPHR